MSDYPPDHPRSKARAKAREDREAATTMLEDAADAIRGDTLKTKRLALDPDLSDGSAWTIHDKPDTDLLNMIAHWMTEAAKGETITIKLVEMSDREARVMSAQPDMREAAAALVAMTDVAKASGLPVFRWLPGMSDGDLFLVDASEGGAPVSWVDRECDWVPEEDLPGGDGEVPVPDLTDRLTVLALIILVQDAWGDECKLEIRHRAGGFCLEIYGFNGWTVLVRTGDTLAEVLVAALAAAPRQEPSR